MNTYRIALRGKIGIVRGLVGEVSSRLMSARCETKRVHSHPHDLHEIKPLSEEEVRNLPIAHRYSA